MKKGLRIITFIVLLLNGISGVAGGYAFIAAPGGETVHISTVLLAGSPFKDFLIPGVVLFSFIGISNILVLYFYWKQDSLAPILLIYQGLLIAAWLAVQIMVIKTLDTLQFVYAAIALYLLIVGIYSKIRTQKEIDRLYLTRKVKGTNTNMYYRQSA